jgi:hypothetical protein
LSHEPRCDGAPRPENGRRRGNLLNGTQIISAREHNDAARSAAAAAAGRSAPLAERRLQSTRAARDPLRERSNLAVRSFLMTTITGKQPQSRVPGVLCQDAGARSPNRAARSIAQQSSSTRSAVGFATWCADSHPRACATWFVGGRPPAVWYVLRMDERQRGKTARPPAPDAAPHRIFSGRLLGNDS